MPIPAGPWGRMVVYQNNEDDLWTNTVWFHPTSAIPGNFNIQTAVNDCAAHFGTVFANPLQVGFGQVKGFRLFVNNGVYTVSADSTTAIGGNEASAELPTEIAAVVQIRTNDPGPSGRGRIFLSGVCKDNTKVSDLSPAGVTLYQAIVTALTGTITMGAVPWVVALCSRKLATIKPATFIRLDRELAQQKRRKPIF